MRLEHRQKRILYLVPDLFGPPGGIARYCRMVCQALTSSGVDLVVVSLHDDQASQGEAAALFPTLLYHPCGHSRRAFVQQALVSALRWRPAIIMVGHAHFAPLGWLLARMMGARLIVAIHGVEVWLPLRAHRRWSLNKADCLLAVSQFTARKAEEINNIPAHKMRIIHNCLDQEADSAVPAARTTLGLSLLTVARINPDEGYKGHDIVIRALPALLRRFPDLVYHVIGDGPGRPALEQLAAHVGVTRSVHFHGIVSAEVLDKHYADASIFIMPSSGEGFGFVFIEAMARGLPVIGGNLDATVEVITDGETGYLVDPHSVEEVGAAAARLLGDAGLRARMGQAAARQVRERFSYDRFRDRLQGCLFDGAEGRN